MVISPACTLPAEEPAEHFSRSEPGTEWSKAVMHIRTPEEYRAVAEEARQLEDAREGTSAFKRRQELVTAMRGNAGK